MKNCYCPSEMAAVLTNDTDLLEPIRIVTQDVRLPVTLLTPTARPAGALVRVASSVRHIQPYISPRQPPDPVFVRRQKPIGNPASC